MVMVMVMVMMMVMMMVMVGDDLCTPVLDQSLELMAAVRLCCLEAVVNIIINNNS
jgi:hypothetical protein